MTEHLDLVSLGRLAQCCKPIRARLTAPPAIARAAAARGVPAAAVAVGALSLAILAVHEEVTVQHCDSEKTEMMGLGGIGGCLPCVCIEAAAVC